ncbi:MAG: Pyruvate kinase [Pseudomonadota bacterium]
MHQGDERVAEYRELAAFLLTLRGKMLSLAESSAHQLTGLHPTFRESGRNLLHYLVLRQHDLRFLQSRLAALGLSSLGRAEAHALATVDSVLQTLHDLTGDVPPPPPIPLPLSYNDGQRLLKQHTEDLLGPTPQARAVRIMVTMPSEAARDYTLVYQLLEQGMDCMRINCAHDGPEAWAGMIDNLRRASRTLGKACQVEMDLGGPKLRTGPVQSGPAVLRIRPRRDALGQVIEPARVWISGTEHPQSAPSHADTSLLLREFRPQVIAAGERIELRDARGARRYWSVLEAGASGLWVACDKTTYLVPGLELIVAGSHDRLGVVGPLEPLAGELCLQPQDILIITRDQQPGRAASLDPRGQVLTPARIGCSLPQVFDWVEPGAPILFDDGRIAGSVETVGDSEVRVRIQRTAPGGSRLRADKGINLPESRLGLAALTDKDLQDLEFVAAHADIIGLSFVNSAEDVRQLQQQIERLGERRPAVVLKIETRRGFENLPSILLAAMANSRCGVMIARGDLAVECGFVRLAEAQEEILWLCEAAHVPVIWATQVLESLAKEGMPSRAEITDAAMSDRAECVMLNKGPHIVSAVEMLDDILCRMQDHQTKKQSMLRELHIAHSMGS